MCVCMGRFVSRCVCVCTCGCVFVQCCMLDYNTVPYSDSNTVNFWYKELIADWNNWTIVLLHRSQVCVCSLCAQCFLCVLSFYLCVQEIRSILYHNCVVHCVKMKYKMIALKGVVNSYNKIYIINRQPNVEILSILILTVLILTIWSNSLLTYWMQRKRPIYLLLFPTLVCAFESYTFIATAWLYFCINSSVNSFTALLYIINDILYAIC